MNTQTLANDVEQNTDSYPVTDMLTAYLGYNTSSRYPRQAGAPQADHSRARDLWDYLGDFA